ncbi:MAG: OstA-like protein [Bacteroidota bacterium]|nr:OstA-like protein [Bacteroidota bacterium]
MSAQEVKKIQILNSDQIISNNIKHPDYWRMIGNVVFSHDKSTMYCDSAYHYKNEDKIQAFSNVKIIKQDSLNMFGEQLTYFGEKSIAKMNGKVKLIDKHSKLETEEITFHLNKNMAYYNHIGKITEQEKTIFSKKGYYHTEKNIFYFQDSVKVIGVDYIIDTDTMNYNTQTEISYFFGPSEIISNNNIIYCENGWYNTKTDIAQFRKNAYILHQDYLLKGDSLYYNKNKNYGKAFSNVAMIDTIQNVYVSGQKAEYFGEEEKTIITEKPLLEVIFENDTLFMHATRFISYQKENEKKILAYNNVKFFKTDLQGKCDSLSYNFSDSIVELYNQPVLWSDNLQITADSIKLLVFNNEIQNMFLNPKPMIISKEDSIDYNQIKGREMIGYFKKNKLIFIDVIGNGQSIFVVRNEEDQKKIGLNHTECTELTLHFKNSLTEVVYKVAPSSNTTPYKKIKEDSRYLKGFIWRINEKPENRNDIY